MARKPARRTAKQLARARSTGRKHAVKPTIPLATEQQFEEAFGDNSLTRIGLQAKKGRYFSGEELATAIEANRI